MTPQEARQALPELAEWVDAFRAVFDTPESRCRVLYLSGRGIELGKPQPSGVVLSVVPPKLKGKK